MNAKLTARQVRKIASLIEQGVNTTKIAEMYCVRKATITSAMGRIKDGEYLKKLEELEKDGSIEEKKDILQEWDEVTEEILKNEERKRIHERFNCVFGRDCSRGDRDDRSCNLPGKTGGRK